MRAKVSIACLSGIVVLTVGCDLFGPQPRLSHAATTLACGPADEGFTAILLANDPIDSAEPSFPYVRVVFWEPVSALAGRIWDITTDMGPGAWYFTGHKVQSAISGRVTVTSVDTTNKVDGAVDLQFPSRSVETEFNAPWLNTGVTCP